MPERQLLVGLSKSDPLPLASPAFCLADVRALIPNNAPGCRNPAVFKLARRREGCGFLPDARGFVDLSHAINVRFTSVIGVYAHLSRF